MRLRSVWGMWKKIIHDHLHMENVSSRWNQRLLTPFQKQERVDCSQALLTMYRDNQEDFYDRLITQDETWVHHYNTKTKAEFKQWKNFDSSPPKKARVQPSAGKVMLTLFWDQRGVVMLDYLAKGTIPCLTSEQNAKIYQNGEVWNADHRGYGSCRTVLQFTFCPDRSTVLRLWNLSSSSLLSRLVTLWLPPLSIHEVIFKEKAIQKRWNLHFQSQGIASVTTCWVQYRSPKLL